MAEPQRKTAPLDNGSTLSSPRIERLRELYAQLDDPVAQELRTDAELNAICHEIFAIHDAILAAPASGASRSTPRPPSTGIATVTQE